MSIRRHDWHDLVPSFARPQPLAPPLPRADPVGPRPGHRRTPSAEARAIVARMAGFGFSASKISRLTGYRPSTLYRFFRDELQTARDLVDLEVLSSAFDQAVGGPERNFRHAVPSMTRLWLGHRLGWKEPTAYDNPMRVEVDLDRLSDDELNELDRILERASDAPAGQGGSSAA